MLGEQIKPDGSRVDIQFKVLEKHLTRVQVMEELL